MLPTSPPLSHATVMIRADIALAPSTENAVLRGYKLFLRLMHSGDELRVLREPLALRGFTPTGSPACTGRNSSRRRTASSSAITKTQTSPPERSNPHRRNGGGMGWRRLPSTNPRDLQPGFVASFLVHRAATGSALPSLGVPKRGVSGGVGAIPRHAQRRCDDHPDWSENI